MGWVAGLHETGDESVNLVLLETDAKGELVVCGCRGFVLPSARNLGPRVLLSNIVPSSEERLCESKMSEAQENGEREKLHREMMWAVGWKSTGMEIVSCGYLKDER